MSSAVSFDCAKLFFRETEELRRGAKYMLLVRNEYKSHVQLDVLRLLKEFHVVFIELPAHIFHMFQPLDVSVHCSFKSIP